MASAKRSVYPGRFVELQNSYNLFLTSGGKRGRPLPGLRVTSITSDSEQLPRAFENRWLLLEHVGGFMPDIRAAAILSRIIRDALLSGYKRIGRESNIPEVISGHARDGSASRLPHLAIIPLSFAGFPHSDGHMMGFALVPPLGSTILDDVDFRRALRELASMDENRGRRIMTIQSKTGSSREESYSLELSPTSEAPAGKQSMDPILYTRPARTFASVTPMALDRHLKEKGAAQADEIIEQICVACTNVGLPEPVEVIPNKHSAIVGAPSAYPSGNSPAWTQWRLPATLKTRQLTHAVIRFSEPVQGPLLLCAGRFVGIGLFRPLDGAQDS
jgi:CRISPR-associated protein Csb2